MATVFLFPPSCISLMQLHFLFLFRTCGIWATTGLGKSHYCGGRAWAITNYIYMELCVNKRQRTSAHVPPPPTHTHTLTQHLQVELWGVNVTNMAAKSVDHFWAGLYVQLMHDIASTVDVRACMKYCKRGATRYVGLLGNLAYSRKARIRFILSVHPSACTSWTPT